MGSKRRAMGTAAQVYQVTIYGVVPAGLDFDGPCEALRAGMAQRLLHRLTSSMRPSRAKRQLLRMTSPEEDGAGDDVELRAPTLAA